MTKSSIKSYIESLCLKDRQAFLEELQSLEGGKATIAIVSHPNRRQLLDNKQGCCPHCGHLKYVRNGKDKGSQRYKCTSYNRNFTEYTGTWMERLHHKEKTGAYLELMLEEKSLDAIKMILHINK